VFDLKANRSIPHATVIPVLIYPDVREAVEGNFALISRIDFGHPLFAPFADRPNFGRG